MEREEREEGDKKMFKVSLGLQGVEWDGVGWSGCLKAVRIRGERGREKERKSD